MRIIITGSRNYAEPEGLERLKAFLDRVEDVCIVQGGCSTGADRMAKDLATQCNYKQEEFPANWSKYGRAAGPIRNQDMVDSGADVCLAFPMPDSRGTIDCMYRATAAGIPVKVLSSYRPKGF